eukprot:1194346-Prorocentrum_minimum.AAC.5
MRVHLVAKGAPPHLVELRRTRRSPNPRGVPKPDISVLDVHNDLHAMRPSARAESTDCRSVQVAASIRGEDRAVTF